MGSRAVQGVPLRLELGPRDMDSGVAMLARRDNGGKQSCAWGELAAAVPQLLEQIQVRWVAFRASCIAWLWRMRMLMLGKPATLHFGDRWCTRQCWTACKRASRAAAPKGTSCCSHLRPAHEPLLPTLSHPYMPEPGHAWRTKLQDVGDLLNACSYVCRRTCTPRLGPSLTAASSG